MCHVRGLSGPLLLVGMWVPQRTEQESHEMVFEMCLAEFPRAPQLVSAKEVLLAETPATLGPKGNQREHFLEEVTKYVKLATQKKSGCGYIVFLQPALS